MHGYHSMNLSADHYKRAEAHLTTDLCSTPGHETGQAAPTELETRRGRSRCNALFIPPHKLNSWPLWDQSLVAQEALYLEATKKRGQKSKCDVL